MTLSEPPEIKVKDLVKNNWDKTNITSEITPDFKTESPDFNDIISDSIYFHNPTENSTGGGDTGYSSLNQSGGAPTQRSIGTVQADCLSRRKKDVSSVNPKQVIFDISEEVKRIIRNKFDQDSEIDFFTFLNKDRKINTDVKPTIYRYKCEIRYHYIEQG